MWQEGVGETVSIPQNVPGKANRAKAPAVDGDLDGGVGS